MSGQSQNFDQSYSSVTYFSEDDELPAELINLKKKFVNTSGGYGPSVMVRVPGRVNLIGEHIDYCGYGVCPMAIEQQVFLAARLSSGSPFLIIKNTDASTYPDVTITNKNFEIDFKKDGWASYVLCGLKGALDRSFQLGKTISGLTILVSGTVPPGAGLSSSSALVCAAFLATVHLLQVNLSKSEMASLCAECERYIGTAGGGMDQAIAFLATPGCAKHIEFNPLRAEDVPLPKDCIFIIGHSCVIKNKAASADFNTRVVETHIASQILAKKNYMDWRKCKNLADVQKFLNCSLSCMIEMVKDTFKAEPYSKRDVCTELNVTENELDEVSLTENTRDIGYFLLRQRALHVFEEAKRVEDWVTGCRAGWTVEELGRLLTASHESLQHQYQCSAARLDELVAMCLDSGSVGARLTGAGWGGCVVAMVPSRITDNFLRNVALKFYGGTDCIGKLLFATSASQGAEIFSFKNNVIN